MKELLSILLAALLCAGPFFSPADADEAEKAAVLVFSSFDGGGPEYSVEFEDPSLVTYSTLREYDDPEHEMMTGSGYRIVYTFTGLKSGATDMTVRSYSPLTESFESHYTVTVGEDLAVTLRAERKLGRFEMHRGGSFGDSFVVVAFMDGYALSVSGSPFRTISGGAVASLLAVFEEYGLFDRDFSGEDGDFRLEVSFTDEAYIFAAGTDSFPADIAPAIEEILDILKSAESA